MKRCITGKIILAPHQVAAAQPRVVDQNGSHWPYAYSHRNAWRQANRSLDECYILPDGRFLAGCNEFLADGFCLTWLDSHVPVDPNVMQQRREILTASGLASTGGQPPIVMAAAAGIQREVRAPTPTVAPKRERYVCPRCEVRAWAAPETLLECGTCNQVMEARKSGTRTLDA
jgi:hypothetical protein